MERDERSIAHMRALLESYHRYASISGQIPGEALLALQEIREPEKLVDTIAVNMVKDLAEKQELLNTLDVIERYEKMLSISEREIQILGIEYEISEKTKQQIEKFQKKVIFENRCARYKIPLEKTRRMARNWSFSGICAQNAGF